MSSLLQLLNRFLPFWVFFSMVSLASAVNFGASPPSLLLEGIVGEDTCVNATIFSSASGTVEVHDRWALTDSHDIALYTLSAESQKLVVEYPVSFLIKDSGVVPFCVRAVSAGTYHGLLVANLVHNSGAVGIWVTVHVRGTWLFVTSLSEQVHLTGLVIVESGLEPVLLSTSVLLIILLVFILLVYKRLS